jgi:hypothetical protein
VIAFLIGTSFAAAAPPQRLANVTRIFVARPGTELGTELMRQKIVSELTNLRTITIVDSPGKADATLAGIATVEYAYYPRDRPSRNTEPSPSRAYCTGAAVRLVGRSGLMLWYGEARPGALGSFDSLGYVAGEIAGKLISAIEKDKSARAGSSVVPGTEGCPIVPGGATRLKDIRRLFMEPPSKFADAEVIRAKLLGRLFQSRKFAIVECASDADATLSAASWVRAVQTPVESSGDGIDYAFTDYHASTTVRLLGASKQPLLELDLVRKDSDKWTASSKVASQAAKEILSAIQKDRAR